jgi:hypothetical protein
MQSGARYANLRLVWTGMVVGLCGGLRFGKEILISLMAPTRKMFVPSVGDIPQSPGASCILTLAGEVTQLRSVTGKVRLASCHRCRQTQHGGVRVALQLRTNLEVRATVGLGMRVGLARRD